MFWINHRNREQRTRDWQNITGRMNIIGERLFMMSVLYLERLCWISAPSLSSATKKGSSKTVAKKEALEMKTQQGGDGRDYEAA